MPYYYGFNEKTALPLVPADADESDNFNIILVRVETSLLLPGWTVVPAIVGVPADLLTTFIVFIE